MTGLVHNRWRKAPPSREPSELSSHRRFYMLPRKGTDCARLVLDIAEDRFGVAPLFAPEESLGHTQVIRIEGSDFTPFFGVYSVFLEALRQSRRATIAGWEIGTRSRARPSVKRPSKSGGRTVKHRHFGANAIREDGIGTFLEKVYTGVASNKIDETIDVVFEEIDGRLNRSDLDGCDEILRRANPGRLDSNLVVALLVITLPVKDRLQKRADFIDRAKPELRKNHTDQEIKEMLQGLE